MHCSSRLAYLMSKMMMTMAPENMIWQLVRLQVLLLCFGNGIYKYYQINKMHLLRPQVLFVEPLYDALSFCLTRLLFPIYTATVTAQRKAYFSQPHLSLPRSSNRTEDLIINGLSALSDLNSQSMSKSKN